MAVDKVRLGVVGAGTMGRGIALAALYAGLDVVLVDPFAQALDEARVYLEKFLAKKNLLERMGQVELVEIMGGLSHCDLVIEAAPEKLDLKRDIFLQIEAICDPQTLILTNTSTLSVTAIAAGLADPSRAAGLHFFNPAPVLPLVEVIRGVETAEDTLARVLAFSRVLGKTPVVVRDTPGFIVNRVARPFYGEALRIVGEGVASYQDVDRALCLGAGFRMGPFALMDLIGIDVNAGAMQSMYEQTFGEPRYRPHWIQMQKLASGHLGRKTGRGFYDYREGAEREEGEEVSGGTGGGTILWVDGAWSCGAAEVLREAGYDLRSDVGETDVEAVWIVCDRDSMAASISGILDRVPGGVPVFVQCLDATLDAHELPLEWAEQCVGIDTLFFAGGKMGVLTSFPGLREDVRAAAGDIVMAAGCVPLWVEDAPGLVVPRVVCMLINEAAFAVQDQVADAATMDLAMKLGVNYPRGLISWGTFLGWARVLAVLEHLHREYGEERYRPCRLIRRWARQEVRSRG